MPTRIEQFVVELCRRLSVTCEVGRVAVDRLAAESGDGIEAAARTARYHFLEQTAGRLGARFVATAHTADDQAETILHRIIRGTGIRGLSGMARARPLGHATLIRPLLGVRRAELQTYLDALGQPYRHDQSNADLRFTRNRIRHQTMPQLREQYNAGVAERPVAVRHAGRRGAGVGGWAGRRVACEVCDDRRPRRRTDRAGGIGRSAALPRPRVVDGLVAASRLAFAGDGPAEVGGA